LFSGRHLFFLGIIACAGLLSVHYGQRQTVKCYDIAAMEKELRELRDEIELCKIKHQALQSPKAVMLRVQELNLPLGPASTELPGGGESEPRRRAPETQKSLGIPQPLPPVIPVGVEPVLLRERRTR
jgi:hypothetical protein